MLVREVGVALVGISGIYICCLCFAFAFAFLKSDTPISVYDGLKKIIA